MSLVNTLLKQSQTLSESESRFSEGSIQIEQQLQLLSYRLEGHINTTDLLAEKVQETLGLVS